MKPGNVPKQAMPTNVASLGGSGPSLKIPGNSGCGCDSPSVSSASGGNMGTEIRGTTPISPATSTRNVPVA